MEENIRLSYQLQVCFSCPRDFFLVIMVNLHAFSALLKCLSLRV